MATSAEIARGIFDALAKKDLDAALAHNTEDSVDDFVAIGEVRGRTAIRQFFEELLAAFPDFEIAVERIVADDEAAAVQWLASGSFSGGPFRGIEPTGRHVEIRGVDVMEIEDGHLRHKSIYLDSASFARQVGMLPRTDSVPEKAMLSTFNALTRARQRLNRTEKSSRG